MYNKNNDNICIFAIVVNYCHPEITLSGIKSLRESDNVNLHIIVVENASPDNSYTVLKSQLPTDVILLCAVENRGFAAGNNVGIQYALEHGADYIMLINNDTEIDPSMVSVLLQYTDDHTVTAPKMFYFGSSSKIWFAGGKYLEGSGRFIHVGESEEDGAAFQNNLECDFLTGCCFMMTGNVARKVGLLDESYFMYVEDVDYSLRLRQNGVKLLMIPSAKLWHKVGVSSGGEKSKFNIYYGNRNRFYLQKKFGFSFFTRMVTFVTRIILMIKGILFNTSQKYILYAIIDFYKNRMGKQERSFCKE